MAYWIFDAGHGGVDPGAIGQNGLHEADVNLKLTLKVKEILVANGERVDLIRTNDATVDLSARPVFANSHGCDYFVSFHNNSSDNRSVSGTEVHVQGLGGRAEALGKSILNELAQAISPNRGLKVSNLCVNRDSNMPSCLIEGDFISNPTVEAQMRTQEWINKVSIAIAKGCLKMVGKSYNGSQPTQTPVTPQPVQPQPQTNTKHPIMGKAELTKEQIVKYILSNNPNPQIPVPIDEFVSYYFEEGAIEGVRPDYAACQSILETGCFKFGNDVKPEQCNYSGIGTVGNGVAGASFSSARQGVKAQIQHLKAYASTESLKSQCVDPRYNLVTKAIAPCLEDLSGRWATDSGYSTKILSIYEKIKSIKVDSTPISQPTTPNITQPVVSQPTTPVQNVFQYPNNAQVVGDDLYIRDINSNVIPNRYVSNGDKITVLDVLYSKQLTLVQYPTSSGVRSGYVKNVTNLIKYFNSYNWRNGSTTEDVFDKPNGTKIGSLSPNEKATKLFVTKDGWTCVVYDTDKGSHTKSGFVKFAGL